MTEEEYYAKIKAAYEASTDDKLVEWARPYFEGTKKPDNKDKYIVCSVSERAALDIYLKTGGRDVHGFECALRCDIIRHVDNRHGEHGEHDNTISDINDLGRIGYVLNNYDEVVVDGGVATGFLNKDNRPAEVIRFVKRINGHVYSAEAITDSPKKKTLYILSMYKGKTHKKESRLLTDNQDPELHVQNAPDSSVSILPQSEKNVKTLDKNNSDRPKPAFEQQLEQQLSERRQAHLDDIEAMDIPPERKAELRQKVGEIYSVKPPTIAEIKAELRGKSPKEIAELSQQARQKNKQNGQNLSNNGGKSPSGNGSGGNSGR